MSLETFVKQHSLMCLGICGMLTATCDPTINPGMDAALDTSVDAMTDAASPDVAPDMTDACSIFFDGSSCDGGRQCGPLQIGVEGPRGCVCRVGCNPRLQNQCLGQMGAACGRVCVQLYDGNGEIILGTGACFARTEHRRRRILRTVGMQSSVQLHWPRRSACVLSSPMPAG